MNLIEIKLTRDWDWLD